MNANSLKGSGLTADALRGDVSQNGSQKVKVPKELFQQACIQSLEGGLQVCW